MASTCEPAQLIQINGSGGACSLASLSIPQAALECSLCMLRHALSLQHFTKEVVRSNQDLVSGCPSAYNNLVVRSVML